MAKIKKIKKRDGRIVDFDSNKIIEVIWKASKAVGGSHRRLQRRRQDLPQAKMSQT